jgi:quercetin dioxygenase-like cupin family protein
MPLNISKETAMRANVKSSKLSPADASDAVNQTAFQTIAQNLALVTVSPARSARVKSALVAWAATENVAPAKRVSPETETAEAISTRHAFADNTAIKWRAINPLVSMQVLHDDGETLSWYARFQPGGRLPAHDHTGDEESLVISGSCYLNDKLMQVGDYQICRAGSRHDNVFSEHGCLLFIRTPKAMLRSHAHA